MAAASSNTASVGLTQKTFATILKLIRYLNTKGQTNESLFRASADTRAVQDLRLRLERGELTDVQTAAPDVCAQLLRLYLAELPQPLFTYALHDELVNTATGSANLTDRLRRLRELLNLLPTLHRKLADILLLFLHRQTERTGADLAPVFAPVLLRGRDESAVAAGAVAAVRVLIEHFDALCEPAADEGVPAVPTPPDDRPARVKKSLDLALLGLHARLEQMQIELALVTTIPQAVELAKRLRAARKLLEGVQPLLNGTAPPAPLAYKTSASTAGGSIESGVHSMQGRRKTMEDQHVAVDDLAARNPLLPRTGGRAAVYAVLDGHGGSDAARFAADCLVPELVDALLQSPADVPRALQRAFASTDRRILEEGARKNWKNGSTCVMALILGPTLFVANAGDSEAVLFRKSTTGDKLEAQVLSVKHSATSEAEKERIEKAGGHVFHGRLYGTLAVARSFGDAEFKRPIADADFVIAEPHISPAITLGDTHVAMVLACDGLWEKVSYEHAAEVVFSSRKNARTARDIAETLARDAYDRGSKDNITALVLLFTGGGAA